MQPRGGVVPDLCYLTKEKHVVFAAFLSSARMSCGMPNFSDILSLDEMELIRQYLIKRTQDLQTELQVPIKL